MFVPYFGYYDAAAAIAFLERAFGFEKRAAYSGPDGRIVHAEMVLEGSFIMLGSLNQRRAAHDVVDRSVDHGIYIPIEDVDRHFERAKSAGATVLFPPEDTEFGSRRYRVLDLEGYEWSFGTYRPG